MAVLVIGNGSLGKEICRQLIDANIPFYSTTINEIDITNELSVYSAIKNYKNLKLVINCAAFTDVALCEVEKEKANLVNALGVKNLAEACKRYSLKLIHFSTDYVYSGLLEKHSSEEVVCEPLNHYGISKLQGDREIQNTLSDYKILRIQNLYSKDGPNFLSKMWKVHQRTGEIQAVTDQFMSPCSAVFVASMAIMVMMSWEKIPSGIYNVTHDDHCSFYEFTKFFYSMTDTKGKGIGKVSYKKFSLGVVRPNYSLMDCTKFKKALGLNSLGSWKDDVTLYYKRYPNFHKLNQI